MRRRRTKGEFKTINQMYKSGNDECWYCGIESGNLTVDHKIPRSRGGADSPDNWVSACGKCNGRKGALTVEEYRAIGAATFDGLFYGERVIEDRRLALKRELEAAK